MKKLTAGVLTATGFVALIAIPGWWTAPSRIPLVKVALVRDVVTIGTQPNMSAAGSHDRTGARRSNRQSTSLLAQNEVQQLGREAYCNATAYLIDMPSFVPDRAHKGKSNYEKT